MNAIVNNSMKCIHEIVTFYRWMILLSEGKIVSVPEFLQRPKLVEDWTKKNYEVAKEYIVSVWKGTHGLDGFSIVPIDLLIEKLKDKGVVRCICMFGTHRLPYEPYSFQVLAALLRLKLIHKKLVAMLLFSSCS